MYLAPSLRQSTTAEVQGARACVEAGHSQPVKEQRVNACRCAQRSFPLYIIQSRTCWGWGLGVVPTIKKSLLTLTQSRQSPCRHAYRPISQWVLTESTNHKLWQCFSGELNTMVCYHFFFFSFGYMSAVRYLCALPEEAVRFPD